MNTMTLFEAYSTLVLVAVWALLAILWTYFVKFGVDYHSYDTVDKWKLALFNVYIVSLAASVGVGLVKYL